MPFAYRLADYGRYREQVGEATYIDITRRTDPARNPQAWENLGEILTTYGAPWVVQLWTKDIQGTLRLGESFLGALREAGTTITAQVTVTGLASSVWEPLVPPDGLRYIPQLARLIGGAEHIIWRYDPLIPPLHDPARYRALARQAAELGIRRGVINFIAPPGRYARVDRRLGALLPAWAEGMPGYDLAWQESTAAELIALATEASISLGCCAECAILGERVPGLRRAACGDYGWFVALSGKAPLKAPFRGSRPGCGCARYFDVGSYGNWARCHRCAYCYAG
jgi:hypothetical protein